MDPRLDSDVRILLDSCASSSFFSVTACIARDASLLQLSLDLSGEASTSCIFWMGTIDSLKYVLTQSALDALYEKYHIPDYFHPQLPAPNSRIRNSPAGKIEMDLFAFIHYADPTTVMIRERQIREGMQENREDDANVAGVYPNHSNEVHAVTRDEVQTIVADKPKRFRKRKTADGASGSRLPLKKLRGDHNASGSGEPNTGGKSLVVMQKLLDHSALNIEAGVIAASTVLFVTSFMTPTPKHERGDYADSVMGLNLRTQAPMKRFVISSDSTPASNNNVVDDEVTSIVRSAAPVSVRLTMAVVKSASVLAPQTNPELVDTRVQVTTPMGSASLLAAMADIVAKAIHLRAEASKLEATQRSLQDEVQSLKNHNVALEKENKVLDVKVADLATTVKFREQEDVDLDAVITSVKLHNDILVDQVHELETSSARLKEKVTAYENLVDQLEKFQDEKIKE
ncbi:hypothetical protein Tco_1046766 [Tanacetum coccineum]